MISADNINRITITDLKDKHVYFSSSIDDVADVRVYAEGFKEPFYQTTMFLQKNQGYFISHPCFINLDLVTIDFQFSDKTETYTLNSYALKKQPNHILHYYTEEEYKDIEPFINWSFTEIIAEDHYMISNLKDFFYDQTKCIVDLGANIGTFGKYMSLKCDNIEKYICVEPFSKMEEVIKVHNKNINPIVYTKAFNSEIKEINFNIHKNTINSEVNYTDDGIKQSEDTPTNVEKIETITLKEIFEDNDIDIIDILKVDIEGSETHLIKGNNIEYLNKVKYILVEAHSDQIKDDLISNLSNFEVVGINTSPGLPHIFLRNKLLTSERNLKKKRILMKVSCPALGDTLCSTPTIRKVSQSYGQKVDVMTKRKDVFENNPYVDKILEHTELDPIGYDEVYETYNQYYKVNKNMSNTEFYDKFIEVKLSNFEARQLHAMGVGITLYPEEMHYDYIANDQTEISKKVDKNYIVLHVTENWPVRTWPIVKWQKLVDYIKEKTDYKIVTIGKAHKEDGYFGKIDKGVIKLENIDLDTCLYENVGRQDHIQVGEGSLSELWHIINNAKALVSFDSGPIHLAGTTDTHIIQIGSSIRYEKTAPYRNGTQLYKFDFVGGNGCKLFCASDPKYSVKEWGTINSMPYYPECQEKYTEFKCQPTVDQVFEKILELK